jgi:hypothetical protein
MQLQPLGPNSYLHRHLGLSTSDSLLCLPHTTEVFLYHLLPQLLLSLGRGTWRPRCYAVINNWRNVSGLMHLLLNLFGHQSRDRRGRARFPLPFLLVSFEFGSLCCRDLCGSP